MRRRFRPRIMFVVVMTAAFALIAGLAQAFPATTPDNTGMVNFPGTGGGGSNAVAVRTIAQFGPNVWVGGRFTEIDDGNGIKVADAANLAAFTSDTGLIASGVHIPLVTSTVGDPEIFDASVGPDGNLYFAGNFDRVDGQVRHNVAAVDAATGALTSFAPSGVGSANAVLATASAIYVGTGKLLSFQLNGAATPGYTAPITIIDAGLRAHETLPQIRDIQLQGNTLVAACQCDSLTDANGTRTVKAAVEIDAATGTWVNWRPANLADSSGAFGINLIMHAFPGSGAPTVYLAAGGSDFSASYDFATGAQRYKTDTSGSNQAIAWFQGTIAIGGHFDWTESPSGSSGCGDNGAPNTQCYHTPKLTSLDPVTGAVLLDPANANKPWNPGICCKYNGVWALLTDNGGSALHVGGEFTEVGGSWSGSGTNWALAGFSNQKFYARLAGPASTTVPLSVQKAYTAGATGSVTSAPSGIACGVACLNSGPTDFNQNALVTLTATPSFGNTFTGWSSADPGFDCPGTGDCTVTMDEARTVVAHFAGISFELSVSVTGAGTGTVASNPTGISCGVTCSAFFAQNSSVTLTPTPGPNSAFNGWSGACAGTGACVVTMDAAKSVTADFRSTSHTLVVARTGAGSGSVKSTPNGINCGATCTKAFTVGSVTLTATAPTGSAFNGWTGGGCSGLTPTCVVTMDTDQNVTADFEPARSLNLTVAGTGGGTVTSDPIGMNCTASCAKGFVQGSTVTLTAAAGGTSVFTGWSGTGGCTGTGTCVLVMSAAKSVTATFQPGQLLTVTPAGSGAGTITSDVAGINCGLTCSANYLPGTVVTLSAAPDTTSSSFSSWSGEGCVGSGTCQVTMDQARNVTATFTLVPRALAVSVAGNGTVTDTPGPINCTGPVPDTGTCNASYQHGTDVQLVATPVANWSLTGWSGACAGTDICVVSMTAAQSVTATFERINRTVTVAKDGTGTGLVTSDVAGIDCGDDCAEGYNQGDAVVLTAAADPGSVFTGWSGACSGTGSCNLTIDATKNVTATFELLHTLTVVADGSGSITSDVGGIACPGTTCVSDGRTHNTHVILTATPDPGSAFTGWSGGGCSGTSSTCDVTMDSDKTVTASFGTAVTLTVALGGAGTGTVSTLDDAIDCPPTCAHDFPQDSSVTLHASADAASVFVGWSSPDAGFDCPGTSDCTVTMDQSRSVTATFTPLFLLTVTKTGGTGSGTVTSLPPNPGIDCGATCQSDFPQGTAVVLHAAPGAGSTFAGWSDSGCTGLGDCTITMDAAKSVNAIFNIIGNGTPLPDNDPAIAYNGWFGVADAAANGGFYRMSSVKNDKATWKSPVTTSVTWVTRTGPDGGKASVTIDGVNKGTVDLYSISPASQNQVYSGLSNAAHTVVIKALHTKSTASSGFNVRSDALVVGVTTTQESDPSIQYDTWKSISNSKATDATYRQSAANTATVTVTFSGTSIDWVTTRGKAFGQASVMIDGVNKGIVDMYQSATVWKSLVTFSGLSSGPHSMVIQVLGQKNALATSTKVIVDGFIVHP